MILGFHFSVTMMFVAHTVYCSSFDYAISIVCKNTYYQKLALRNGEFNEYNTIAQLALDMNILSNYCNSLIFVDKLLHNND